MNVSVNDDDEDDGASLSSNSFCLEEANRVRDSIKAKLDAMEEARTRKPWKRKSKRKPNPQTKLKKFYPPKMTDEGYPLSHCEYEPMEKRQVYRPPKYVVSQEQCFGKHLHCVKCHLKPCITNAYFKEASTLSAHRTMVDGVSSKDAKHEVLVLWKNKYRMLMKPGRAYTGATQCMKDVASQHFASSDEDSDGSSDEELFDEADPKVLSKLFGSAAAMPPKVCYWSVVCI